MTDPKRITKLATKPTTKRAGRWPTDFWREELAGLQGYPKTPEAWGRQNAAQLGNIVKARTDGKLTRRGVPNGRGGEKPQLEVERRNSRTDAERMLPVWFPEWGGDLFGDAKVSADAMKVVLEIMYCVHNDHGLRLSAARMVLEWSSARPVNADGKPLTAEAILHAVVEGKSFTTDGV